MSLRTRLTVLTSGAVALAIAGAAVAAWFLIYAAMLGDLDARLIDRARHSDRIVALAVAAPEPGDAARRLTMMLQDQPTGLQLLDPEGRIVRQVVVGPLSEDLAGARLPEPRTVEGEPVLETVTLGGNSYRMLSAAMSDGGTMRLLQPLGAIDTTLNRVGWLLGGTAVAGVALAALLGFLVAASALRPVDRLVAATEDVSATRDLGRRIPVVGRRRDEIGRLALAMNRMLVALDRARTEQRELTENAGHELRTPLTVLRNDIGLLARAEQPGSATLSAAQRRELLRDLDAQLEGLGDLVTELVDLARGTAEPEPPRATPILPLVERAVARTRRVDPSIEVRVRGDADEAVVRPGMLESAVANLVRNAIQASTGAGPVEVEVVHDARRLRIEVSDRGHGLRDGEIDRLFDRFFRGAASRDRLGSGLGLAIVAQAAEVHGGTARARRRPGGGAVFTIDLPRQPLR